MSKRRKVSLVVTGRKRGLPGLKNIQLVSGTTGGVGKLGVIYASIATTGAVTGKVYIAINTAGTGTVITD